MEKTDESIWRICAAAIRQSTCKPIDYPLTTFFETFNADIIQESVTNSYQKELNESPIALTFIDGGNWTLVTTRRVISKIKTDVSEARATDITSRRWFDFKGYRDKPITYGKIEFNNTSMDIIIETGFASMIIIYAIKTLVAVSYQSDEDFAIQMRRWKKRGLLDN
jgi:hypothetical protein